MSENSIIPYNQLKEMAADVAKSNLFGVKTPEQAMGLMLLSQAEGIHPMRAIQDYHIIEGKPSKKPEAMLRDFIAAGGSVKWVQYDEKVVEAIFSHPSGGTVTVKWTIEMAAVAGLAKKAVWINYPRSMLRNRTIAEGVRAVYPAATAGMYTPEEAEMINVTPDAAAQVQSGTLATAEELKARAAQRAQQQQKDEPIIIEQPMKEVVPLPPEFVTVDMEESLKAKLAEKQKTWSFFQIKLKNIDIKVNKIEDLTISEYEKAMELLKEIN